MRYAHLGTLHQSHEIVRLLETGAVIVSSHDVDVRGLYITVEREVENLERCRCLSAPRVVFCIIDVLKLDCVAMLRGRSIESYTALSDRG